MRLILKELEISILLKFIILLKKRFNCEVKILF